MRALLWSALVSILLTGFFHVHETLPPALRAPTSLLLTPIAIGSGICYYLSIPLDVYESIPLQFVSCLIFLFPLLLLLRFLRKRMTSR